MLEAAAHIQRQEAKRVPPMAVVMAHPPVSEECTFEADPHLGSQACSGNESLLISVKRDVNMFHGSSSDLNSRRSIQEKMTGWYEFQGTPHFCSRPPW